MKQYNINDKNQNSITRNKSQFKVHENLGKFFRFNLLAEFYIQSMTTDLTVLKLNCLNILLIRGAQLLL